MTSRYRSTAWTYMIALCGASLTGCGENATSTRGAATSAKPTVSSTSVAPRPARSASATPSTTGASAEDTRPLYYTRAMTTADLRGRSLRELALLRNTIYARVGNRFRRPWLRDHFRRFDWYAPKDEMDTTKLSAIDKANAKRVGEFDAALTRQQLEAMRDDVVARKAAGRLRPEDAVELSLLSQRLGEYLGDDPERAHPLENQARLEALLRVEDLATLSRRDLRILRNMVYARRGRSFASKVVRSYFASAAWYRPRPDYDDAQLTAIDRKNIAIIRSVEDELGGPIHENPLFDPKKLPDYWFVMA